MTPLGGIFIGLVGLALFLLGWGLGERNALSSLLVIFDREGLRPDDLPAALCRRVRHRRGV